METNLEETRPKQLFFSFNRLWVIGKNTMTEVIRQKFFYILVIFGIAVLASSKYFSQFSVSGVEQIKFIKDFSLAAITIFGVLIAIVSTAQLLPLELDNRTIYPILAKPVYRIEFLIGKYIGIIVLLLLTLLMMSLIFVGFLLYSEKQLLAEAATTGSNTGAVAITPQETSQQIIRQTRDPNLIKAISLIYVKVMIVSAFTLLISTFATSVIFSVVASTMIYICGHLESTAREAWVGGQTLLDTGHAFFSKLMLLIITFFVPDLNAFNVADAIVLGQHVSLAYVGKTIGYGLLYSAVVLFVACFIFEEKEI